MKRLNWIVVALVGVLIAGAAGVFALGHTEEGGLLVLAAVLLAAPGILRRGASAVLLAVAIALGASTSACGGSSEHQVPDVVKRAAQRCVEAVIDELGAGGEAPPPIDRTYPEDHGTDSVPQEETTKMAPTIGRVVLYKLSQADVAELEKVSGLRGCELARYDEGDEVPAMVVRTARDEATPKDTVNLRLLCDGAVSPPWFVGRREGTEPGRWRWPEIARAAAAAKAKAPAKRSGKGRGK